MPVIPIANEQQRITPSSPVPIGASESGRIMNEAVSRLGGAITDLGLVLAKADKESKVSMARAKAAEKAAKYGEQRSLIRARLSRSHTPTSIQSLRDAIAEESASLAAKIFDEDPEVADDALVTGFLKSSIADIDRDSTVAELADGAKLYEVHKQAVFENTVATHTGQVRSTFNNESLSIAQKLGIDPVTGKDVLDAPPGNMREKFVEMSKLIEGSDSFSDAQKQQIILRKRTELVSAAVDALSDQKTNQGYQDALLVLDLATKNGSINAETSNKMHDEIQKDWNVQLDKEEKLRRRIKERKEELKEEAQEKNATAIRGLVSGARTERELIDITEAIYTADLSEPQRNALLGFKKEVSQIRSDRIVSNFIGEMVANGATPESLKRINDVRLAPGSQLSDTGYEELMRFYGFAKNEESKTRFDVYRSNVALIDAYKKDTVTDSADMYQRQQGIMLENLKRDYFQKIQANPAKDPQKIFEEEILPMVPELNLKFIKGKGVVESISALSFDDAELAAASKELLEAQKSGDNTRIREAQMRLRKIQDKKTQGK